MALRYRLGPARRAFNAIASQAIALGISPPSSYILTTVGRKTGQPRSTPVSVVKRGGVRYLVAPYGRVGWVHNVRASGRVTLSKRGRVQSSAVVEVTPTEAAPVLRTYLRKFPVVRPFFDVGFGASDEAYAAEAPRHPVFRIDG